MRGLGRLSAKRALKRSLLAGAALLALVTTGGSQALASAGCDAVNAGAFNVHFTQPNSVSMNIAGFAIGDKITFNLTGAEPSGGANAFVVAEPDNTVLLNVSDIMSPRSVSIPVSAVTGTTLQALPQTLGKATLGVTAACTPAASGGATDGSSCPLCRPPGQPQLVGRNSESVLRRPRDGFDTAARAEPIVSAMTETRWSHRQE
jgi:hypothetical protein